MIAKQKCKFFLKAFYLCRKFELKFVSQNLYSLAFALYSKQRVPAVGHFLFCSGSLCMLSYMVGVCVCSFVILMFLAVFCSTVAQYLTCCLFIQSGCQSEFGRYRRGNAGSSGGSYQQKPRLQSSASSFSGEDRVTSMRSRCLVLSNNFF